jgi:TRAP-type C4-dicarboxylate transport system substrate-binding protein
MKRIFCALTLLAVATTDTAAEDRLVFATTNASTTPGNIRVMHPWAARMNEQGKGELVIEVRDGPAIANFTNYYDRVVNDVVQISWGVQDYLGAQFQRSQVVTLPFIYDSPTEAAVAYYRLYKTGLLDPEYTEIHPLMFCAFASAGVHMRAPLQTPDSVRGLKLISGSKVQSDVITRLGAAPVTLPLTQVYEALQRGVADGAVTQWTAFAPFKLGEVTRYHIDTVMGANAGAVFMTKKRYAALSAASRRVIDANSDEAQSRAFGAYWDKQQTDNRELIKADASHATVMLSREQDAVWRRHAEAVAAEWSSGVPDGPRILAAYKELLAKVKAGG